jgi:MSHA biogenesis protein MshJ
MAKSALSIRWQEWSGRFAALLPREKYLISGAVAAALVFGGFTFWIEPGQQLSARLKKGLAAQQAEQAQLRAQLAGLQTQNREPDAANRAQLETLRLQLAATERDLKGFDRSLAAPAQAPVLLQTLLTRHRGLQLVSLTTLPHQPLVTPPAKTAKEGDQTAGAAIPGGNIYKHGIEIRLAGNYHDLLAYVSELEGSKQKLLWGAMQLSVKNYPISELILTVYTLSLDATWLVV